MLKPEVDALLCLNLAQFYMLAVSVTAFGRANIDLN